MAVKAGQILHAMNQFIVDRIQSGGAGNLNIPQERVYELGNYQSVGIVRDVPDLSFSLDVLDVGTQLEALLTGATKPDDDTANPLGNGSTTAAALYDMSKTTSVDIISPFKSSQGAYSVVRGVAVPQLSLESASYKYGLRQNAGETFGLRGDSIYYVPGVPFLVTYTGDGSETDFAFATSPASGTPVELKAVEYLELGTTYFALNVSVNGRRMNKGSDYTDSETGVSFTVAPKTGDKIRIVFGSVKDATDAAINVDYTQIVNADLTAKPAAIRGRDIKVFIGGTAESNKWHDVQSVTVDWKVNLDADWEFGNSHAVNRDYVDAPDVTGTIELKSITFEALFQKMYQVTGVDPTQVIGPQSSTTVPIVIQLLNPDTGGTSHVARGTVLKTIYIPDARFVISGYEGQVSQKMMSNLQFTSDKGILKVFKGAPTPAQLA